MELLREEKDEEVEEDLLLYENVKKLQEEKQLFQLISDVDAIHGVGGAATC